MSQAVFSLSATSKPELLLAALLPDIRDAVSRACYHYSSDPSEIEDICHQMIILLMEDNYRRLRSFHLESSIKTWLTAVALHYVSNYVGRQKKASRRKQSAWMISRAKPCSPHQRRRPD